MKLRVRFLQLPILFDADRLAAEVAALPAEAWRPHPQGYPGNDALALITTHGDPLSDARDGPMGPTPYLLACPYLMQTLEALGATWGRSRLMRLSGDAEVTPHVDTDYYWRDHMRVHVPIVTQPTVRFRCGGDEVNMAAGECWIFDTWSLHSVHNDATRSRIHLVADTVGGDGLLTLMERGRPTHEQRSDWSPARVAAVSGRRPNLAYESRNVPKVMTPWEVRDHLSFLMSDVAPGQQSAGAIGQTLNRFRVNWHAIWAKSGDDEPAWPDYAALLAQTWPRLEAQGVNAIALNNGMALGRCLRALIFESALAGASRSMDAESRVAPLPTGTAKSTPIESPASAAIESRSSARARSVGPIARDPVFDRPVFIVSPPRSGSTLLFETLTGAPNLFTVGGESHRLMESVRAIDPSTRGWDSNRLTAAVATNATAQALRERFWTALRDREGRKPQTTPVRMLEKTPKNALRIPFLAAVFPEARFVYLHRDPRPTLASMIEGWTSGGFRTYPTLPGWSGMDWSFLLTPGWRQLIGAPINTVVASQWAATTRLLIDDLSGLSRDRWAVIHYENFVAAPQAEITRLCETLELSWDRRLGDQLPLARHTVTRPNAEKWRAHAGAIAAASSIWEPEFERAKAFAG